MTPSGPLSDPGDDLYEEPEEEREMGRWDEAERNWNIIRGCVLGSHLETADKTHLLKFLESVEDNGYAPRPEDEDV